MGENIESRMDFIIEQQAQFAVDIQLLKERQTAFAADLESLKEREAETRDMIRQLVDVTMSLGTARKPTNAFALRRKRGSTPTAAWTR